MSTTPPKRLRRSTSQKMLLGVCGGFAEYFEIDPTIVRIVAVVLLIAGAFFATVLVYLLFALLMPKS